MGFHKNMEVAGQVEVADRLPKPKPAMEHAVFFPNRKLRRLSEMKPKRSFAWAGWMLIGVALGVGVGVML